MSATGPQNAEQLCALLKRTCRISAETPVSELHGGVSSIILRVDDLGGPWIAKSPRQRLAVSDEWVVDRGRGGHEAVILRALDGRLGPARVPRLLFFDRDHLILGLEYIEHGGSTYKDLLMTGRGDPATGGRLGVALGVLHAMEPPDELVGDETHEMFEALRLEPYYRVTAERRPELQPSLMTLIEETRGARPRTLVHGDFTPKNVLVSSGEPAVIDWEVIHLGDPAFDLATMTAHFTLKAFRPSQPGGQSPLIGSIRDLWSEYGGPADRGLALRHTGGVLLARLYGKSPVEYLDDSVARARVHVIGSAALNGAFPEVEDLMVAIADSVPRGVTS